MPRRLAGPCKPGCPYLAGQCPNHSQTSTARGYGSAHQAERRDWQRRMDEGKVIICRRCKQPILNDPKAWDLGHPAPKAPEHRACNRATMGRDRA